MTAGQGADTFSNARLRCLVSAFFGLQPHCTTPHHTTRSPQLSENRLEISTDLIIKLVVLATAIIGLIKAANIKLDDTSKTALGAIIGMATPFAIMLMFPAFMLIYFWIMGAMQDAASPGRVDDVEASSMAQIEDMSDAQIMYLMTKEMWTQSDRQELLKLTIEKALATERYDVLMVAVDDVGSSSEKDEYLRRAILQLAGPQFSQAEEANDIPTAETETPKDE